MRAGRIAVIGGGTSCEHDVSLASAAGVAAALAERGWGVCSLTIDRDGTWSTQTGRLTLGGAVELMSSCDAVFPAVHGPRGEDGTLAALCELAGAPYVGSGTTAGALAMDKWATKLVAEAVGVATAPGRLVRAGGERPTYDGPVVVKPVAAGSSHGVSLVERAADLGEAMDRALALDERVLVERRVVGREVDVAIVCDGLGRLVSPALEIGVEGIFDTDDKYARVPAFTVPADLGRASYEEMVAAATRVYDALGCRGVARVDFFLTATGWVLNEVNTMPGFTPHSQVPLMLAAAGTSYVDLVDRLVRGALAGDRVPVLR